MTTLVVALTLLAARNVAGETVVPSALYVPVNAALAAVLVVISYANGFSATEIGISRCSARRGMAIGAAVASGAALLIAVAAAAPTRSLFEDQRMEGVDGPELAYQALVRIPLGTALLEELAFRGVLFASLRRVWSTAGAVGVSSVLFGLWHIRPTLSALETNDLAVEPLVRIAAVVGAVAVTTVAGVLFCRLRLAADSVLAPFVVHATINSSSAIAAYLVLGSG